MKDGAGKKPVWNETFDLAVTNIDMELNIHVWEEDTTGNDDLGEFTITPRLFTKPNPPTEFDCYIVSKNAQKKTAVLYMQASWVPDKI